jgi:Fe-S-cluster containining protein
MVKATEKQELAAGEFSLWLRHTMGALLSECGTEVACGDCVACCTSAYFIHVRQEETSTLDRISADLLIPAPGLPGGHFVLGYDKHGACPMFIDHRCSIFEQRPTACRNYDCRIFVAAGIAPGDDDKARITQRVKQWKFAYPTRRDRDEHLAVQAAATFIAKHAGDFPGGKIPIDPSQLAILAIKVHALFLPRATMTGNHGHAPSAAETAQAIVNELARFDAKLPANAHKPRAKRRGD